MRLVILREVAGSTPSNDVVAGVDCATARNDMAGRASAPPQIDDQLFLVHRPDPG
jgi:hypothetical protein